MRILLTGASSFTGAWFARELAATGHFIVATFRGQPADYTGLRAARVQSLVGAADARWGIEFGDTNFIDICRSTDFDVLLHHAAEMTHYRSVDFDAVSALAKNTRSGREVLKCLAERGCRKLILTGTVFEPFEGVGDKLNRAFNPYGLSKHLTFEWFRFEAERLDLSLGKFVIPNPFGPQEEFRFTSYLAREWAAGRKPTVGTPLYVRDNIHVSLLARAYVRACESLPEARGLVRTAPSGYVESQGSFTHRVAREMRDRTGWMCEFAEADQRETPEPLIRTNSELAAPVDPDWSETEAWNELASYYIGLERGE